MGRLERSLRFEILRSTHVLVIDDNRVVRDTLREMLEQYGATAWVVASAEAALTLLRIFRPSVIVTDLVMPEHDGYWLLQEARRMPGVAVPIVAMTATPLTHPQEETLAKGFDGYLAMPFNSTYLCHVIRSVLGTTA